MITAREKAAHVFERSEHQWYVDGPSCADALFRVETFFGDIHDPCCGMGNVVRAALANGHDATGSDISGRYREWPKADFFQSQDVRDNIVFNPPYGRHSEGGLRLEERAIVHARKHARYKVAALLHLKWMACRLDWLEAQGCVRIWALSPRPSMLPGANILAGEMPGGGSQDYAWYIFEGAGPSSSIKIGKACRDRALDSPESWDWRMNAPDGGAA